MLMEQYIPHANQSTVCDFTQGREKIGLVLTFTNMGFDVVVSDVDTVWLQNPLPYLANYPDADILVSSDSLVSSASATLRRPAVSRM